MGRFIRFFCVCCIVLSGCATNRTILVQDGENVPISTRHTILVRFENPYNFDIHCRLTAYDAVRQKSWWRNRLLIPAKKTVTMKLFAAVNYKLTGILNEDNRQVGNFEMLFSTTDVENQTVKIQLGRSQKAIILNESGREVVEMIIVATQEIARYSNLRVGGKVIAAVSAPGFEIIVYFQDERADGYYRFCRIPMVVAGYQRVVDFDGNTVSAVGRILPEHYSRYSARVKKDQVAF